jgi:hypothetical protein
MGWVSRAAGACLVGAGITFWLAWFLMPLPGTTDPAFILEAVGETPGSVWWSVAVQLVCSALLVPGVLGVALAEPLRRSGAAFAAAALVGIGATGFAADAIYHLLAYEMTLPGVARDAMLPVMARFQSADLAFIVPQLLALLVGVAWLGVLGARARVSGRLVPYLVGLTVVGFPAASAAGSGRRAVMLVALALFSAAIAELRPRS